MHVKSTPPLPPTPRLDSVGLLSAGDLLTLAQAKIAALLPNWASGCCCESYCRLFNCCFPHSSPTGDADSEDRSNSCREANNRYVYSYWESNSQREVATCIRHLLVLSSCVRVRRPLAPGPEHSDYGEAACLWIAGKGVCTVLTLSLHSHAFGLDCALGRTQVPQMLGKTQ